MTSIITNHCPTFENEQVWLSNAQAAKHVCTTPISWEKHRSRNPKAHPNYYKKGRRIFYRRTDLDAWVETGLVKGAA